MMRILESIEQSWAAEGPRHFNWLPVGFGAGIGLYFALPVEPPLWLLPLLAGLLAVVALRLARIPYALRVACVLMACGAATAQVAAHRTHPVMLREAMAPRPVAGVVEDIIRTEHGVRLTLRDVEISGAPEDVAMPDRVRLSVRLKKGSTLELPHIGDSVAIMAGLLPPMGPALPHGFDFARHFYFQGIGAIGYGLPPWTVRGPVDSGLFTQFRNWRVRVSEAIISQLGVGAGGVAAGLITGDARAITEEDFNALRGSNLYHIIAISGEHMVVIAGVIFVSLRLLALLLPARWRLRPEVKAIAAGASLLLVTAYLFVTGLPVSAIRAYGMIALVLLAVMLRRRVDAVRSLAITAFVMLLWNPANLLDPGFQLSFAATLAILALVDSVLRRGALDQPWPTRIATAIGTMLAVSIVAEAATTPFVIAQFNTVSIYGVFANMLATSLVSFYLMPTVALFFVLLPLGAQGVALTLMKYGISGLLALAHWIASFPHAQQYVPSLPGWGVALFALGLLWVCLWQTRWRRFGAVPMALGMLTVFTNDPPDVLIGAGAKQVAFQTPDGYALARGKAASMIPELWAFGVGQGEFPKAGEPDWRCDDVGCVARVKGALIALPRDPVAMRDDCQRAALVVTVLAPAECPAGGAAVLSGDALRNGVSAVWVTPGKLRTEQSRDWQGKRPWSREHEDKQGGEAAESDD